ncbi:helix-turn-helix transcriptional regulator, partial [Acinetobacter baumannii]
RRAVREPARRRAPGRPAPLAHREQAHAARGRGAAPDRAGHTSVEIARKLHLSPRTVETHRAHIHRKLGLGTRAELVR